MRQALMSIFSCNKVAVKAYNLTKGSSPIYLFKKKKTRKQVDTTEYSKQSHWRVASSPISICTSMACIIMGMQYNVYESASGHPKQQS